MPLMNVGGDFTSAELQLQHYPHTDTGWIIRICRQVIHVFVNSGSVLFNISATIRKNMLADHILDN